MAGTDGWGMHCCRFESGGAWGRLRDVPFRFLALETGFVSGKFGETGSNQVFYNPRISQMRWETGIWHQGHFILTILWDGSAVVGTLWVGRYPLREN